MQKPDAIFLSLAISAFLAAGTPDSAAAGFVKNADVGGYRVIVEGGGVEQRKEIQYDADGNVIYDSRGLNLRQLNKGAIDTSLLGGDGNGLELNLDPTASGTLSTDLPETVSQQENATPQKENSAGKNPSDDEPEAVAPRSRSPWAAPQKALARARKILAERQAAEARRAKEKKAETKKKTERKTDSDNSVRVDPRDSLVNQPMTKDGRKMPFYLTGKGIEEGDVDPSARLKDFMRLNENYGTTFESDTYEFEKTERYSNIISMGEWHMKFSSLGEKRTERYGETSEAFSRKFDSPETLERRLLDNSLMWERSRQSHISVNDTLARKLIEKYATGRQSGKFDMRLPAPGERTGLSMQNINRYQFRRSHSDEKGLPAVQPAGGLKNISR